MEADWFDAWVKGYVVAWESNEATDIGRLFSDDALYFTAPFREPWRGRDEIVAGWLDRKDEPGNWRFSHRVATVAGDLGFVQGRTVYSEPPLTFANLWVIRLDSDGRCREFTEWWMEES